VAAWVCAAPTEPREIVELITNYEQQELETLSVGSRPGRPLGRPRGALS